MTLPVVLSQQASHDAEHAGAWFDEQRPGLGREFLLEVERKITFISHYPESCQKFRRSLRRALIHRFNYAVVYQVRSASIEVVAVLHYRQHSGRLAGHTTTSES